MRITTDDAMEVGLSLKLLDMAQTVLTVMIILMLTRPRDCGVDQVI